MKDDLELARDLHALEGVLEAAIGWLTVEAHARRNTDVPAKITMRFIATTLGLAKGWTASLRYKLDGVKP